MSLKKLVEEIIKPILQEGVDDPGILKAIFLAGGPGSGKGYVSKGLFGIPDTTSVSAYGLKVVNQDKALTTLLKKYGFGTDLDDMPEELFKQLTDPSYEDYSGMRSYAKDITAQQKKQYMKGRLGLIIDGTGHKYADIKKNKKELEKIGYDCFMVFVHTDLDIAQKRNMERPRKLSPELVETYWKDVQKNLISFQGLFGNVNFMMVNNNKTLDEKAAQKKFNMLVTKGIGKFINKPVKNHLGKKWIEKQKIMKESVNEAIQPSKAYGFYKLEKGKKIIKFKGSKSAARSEIKKARKKDPKGKYQLIQTLKKDVGDIFGVKIKEIIKKNNLEIVKYYKPILDMKMKLYPHIMLNMVIIGSTFIIGGGVHTGAISVNVHSVCFLIGIVHYLWLIILQHRCFIRNTELVILVYDLAGDS